MPDLVLPDVDSFMAARQSDGDPAPAPDDLPDVDAFMQTRPRRVSPTPQAPASPEAYRITDRYGAPRPGRIHSGTDFAEPMGTPLGAAASGRVVFAGKRGGYGNAIDIKDPDGNVHRYGHLQQIGVGVGDIIGASEQIGLVGSTGHSTGAHTHYEVRPNGGSTIDPLKTNFRPVFGSYVKPFTKLPDVDSFMSNRQSDANDANLAPVDQPAAQSSSNDLPDVDSFMASRGASGTEPTPSAAITGAGIVDSPLQLPPGNYALTDKGVEPQAELSAFNADAGNDEPVIRSETRLQLTPQERVVLQKKVSDAGGQDAYIKQIAEQANPSAPTAAPTSQTAAEKPTDAQTGTKLSRIGVNLENIPREQFPQAATRAVLDSTGFPKAIIEKYLAQNPNMTIRSQYGTGEAVTSDEILQKTKSGVYTVETPAAQMDKIRSEMRQMENPAAETVYQNVRKGIEESDNDISRGVKTGFVSGAAKIEKLFTNLAELTNHGALKDEDLSKGIEYKRQIERAYHDAIADAQIKDPSLKELIARAAGELPPGFLSTTAATMLTGNPISAMALTEGVENSDRGLVPALTGAAHGAFMGGAMGVLGDGATALQAAGRNAALGALDASVQPGARIGDVVQGSATQGLLAGAFHQSEEPASLSIRQDAPSLRGGIADVAAPSTLETRPPLQSDAAPSNAETSTQQSAPVDVSAQPSEASTTATTEKRIYSSRLGKELKVIGRVTDGRLLALDEATGKRSLIKDPRAVGGNREASYVTKPATTEAAPETDATIQPVQPAQAEQVGTTPPEAQTAATPPAGFTGEPLAATLQPDTAPSTTTNYKETYRAQLAPAERSHADRMEVFFDDRNVRPILERIVNGTATEQDTTTFATIARAYRVKPSDAQSLIEAGRGTTRAAESARTSEATGVQDTGRASHDLESPTTGNVVPDIPASDTTTSAAGQPDNRRPDVASTAAAGVAAPVPLSVGHEATATTERGTRINTRYAIVEAPDLVASHDTGLNPNPRFPAELQPRERGRIASEDQINRIARDVRPEYLADSPKASEGAPIVGEDGVVESGNGRTIALQRAYESGNESSSRYRSYLNDNAARLGLDSQAIEQAKQPVLVRVRTSPVDRAQFAREANEQSVAAMSAGEQARSDAQKLSGNLMGQFYPADDGQIVTPANREFIRSFMGDVVSPAERGRYVTGDGQISQEGITRVRNAVFARAYGETPEGVAALQKLAESPDNNVRNITTAMLHKAGRFAAQKEAIATGARYPLDITNDLVAAMGKLSSLREQGTTVDDYMKQGGLFGDDLTPMQKRALQALD
ncbi:MAG: peptidoglycan DD-metalloendopeptidase family protein, partial [Pyrinomonadaceae bacterium]